VNWGRIARWTVPVGVVLVGVYLLNASWLAPVPHGKVRLLAHRGVHQSFDLRGVQRDTCTATRIRPPIAREIENTIPSMRAAFAAGADVVELDVHGTTDGQLAVFHDWTLDCRTNGHGVTHTHSMAYLKTLDVGYGYTADGGKTFPLRGHGVGLLPSLGEVFAAFPQGRFLVNYKSNDAHEGDLLADLLKAHPEWRDRVWAVYGGTRPTERAIALIAGMRGYTRETLSRCLLPYAAFGWTGYLPEGCRNTLVPLPVNFAEWLPGWPNRLQARLHDAGSMMVLYGPYHRGDGGTTGFDSAEDIARIPPGFDGIVSTNEIETIAPLVRPHNL